MSALPITPASPTIEEQAEQELGPLVESYREASDDQRLASDELGRCLLKWRDEYKAQGRAGDGFKALLARLNIPRATAYRLMKLAGDSDSVSRETKFNLERTVKGLSRLAEKLPDSFHYLP